MKIINKGYIIGFIMGAIIFGTTGVIAATVLASNITYDNTNSGINANNVQDAIDSLYTKANNPTIPANYKELSTVTTATESDILNGKTAYNNLGELITGTTFLSNCAKGKINTSDGYSTSTDKLVTSIKPDLILLYPYDNTWATNYHLYYTGYSTTKFIGGDIDGGYSLYDFSDYYTINDNGWFIHNWPTGYNLSYIACAC